jgi:hypothetical protein
MLNTNPWRRLPTHAPYVLPEDRVAVLAFNRRANPMLRIRTALLPEPFLGPLDARVLLLNLNPGYAPENHRVHRRPSFVRALRRTLRGTDHGYPFYYLNPDEDGGGHRWWRSRLQALVSETSNEDVAQGVLCVEYFPYHSVRFGHRAVRVPSQEFGFGLVREALRRKAVVIVMRARRLWEDAVPELRRYRKLYGLNSPQNVAITPRNCPDGFEAAVRQLRRGRHAR